MQRCRLGSSDLEVSRVGFGAWAIGGLMWGGSDEADAVAAIRASLDAGVNWIDTAPAYGCGRSEELVGRAIEGRRQELLVATKCGLRWDRSEGELREYLRMCVGPDPAPEPLPIDDESLTAAEPETAESLEK